MKSNTSRSFGTSDGALLWAAVSTKAQDRYSVDDQLKMMRAWCKEQGVPIIDELVVRGFSRDYWTLSDVVAAAGDDKDMVAFAHLQTHIRRRTFTLFVCYDADRFGRTTSLVHEVIGRITRDCGARILTIFDNTLIDANNAPMIGTLKALKAQQDVDRLKEYREIGMHNRGRDGKSTAAELPLFQKRLRDINGREIGVVINEDLRPLWSDLATAILRGVPWERMETVLFEEFGHGVDGKPYRWNYMRHLVMHPSFWGHAALNYRMKGGRSTKSSAPWIWDESIQPPEGVTVYRNAQPAVYSGILAEDVKAELWRRQRLKGRARPATTFRFSGLLVCGTCGYTMTKSVGGWGNGKVYLRCETRFYDRKRRPVSCDHKAYVRADDLQEYLTEQLQARIANQPSELFSKSQDADTNASRIEEQEKLVATLTRQLNTLISELASAPEVSRPFFRRQIDDISKNLDLASNHLERLKAEYVSDSALLESQNRLIALLREHSVDWLWTQSETFIHQCLSTALAGNQLVIRDGEIVGTHPVRNRQILKKRTRNL